jgi:hypothetical protein
MTKYEPLSRSSELLTNTVPKSIQIVFLIFFWFSVIAFIGLVWAYLFTFSDGISSDMAKWGQTGDFFGGLLNPMIAILNLIVTAIIALQVNHLSNQQSDKQIKAQKEITLLQIRNEVFRDFRNQLNDKFNRVHGRYGINISPSVEVMESFKEAYTDLFDLTKIQEWSMIFAELKLAEEKPSEVLYHLGLAKVYKEVFYKEILKRYFLKTDIVS